MPSETNPENTDALALRALVRTLLDPHRADRLLATTGLTPDDMRERAQDRAVLAAVISFLEAHEPDLIACARTLDVTPLTLVEVRRRLEA